MNVKQTMVLAGIAAAITFAGTAAAQPAGSTGVCNDGSYTTAASKSGACSGHGGVKTWLAADKAAAPAKTTDKAAAPAKATDKAAAPAKTTATADKATADKAATADKSKKKTDTTAATTAPAKTSKTSKTAAAAPAPAPAPPPVVSNKTGLPETAAPGGGRGKVWVNTDTNVYHCQDDRWYGKTLKGEYMTEAQAKANGARPPRGKPCS